MLKSPGEMSGERGNGPIIANCPWGELSVGRIVHGVNCPSDEFS